MNNIVGIPESPYDYEFMVAEKLDNGDFKWIANFAYYNYNMDSLLKSNPKYIVVHNVRISNKELKKGRRNSKLVMGNGTYSFVG